MDFLWAKDADVLLYANIVDNLSKFLNGTHGFDVAGV
jgi:hypothetical protein